MRNLTVVSLLLCLIVLTSAVFAQESPQPQAGTVYELLYLPAFDSAAYYELKVELLDLTLEGESLYVAGQGKAKVEMQFADGGEDAATAITVTASEMHGYIQGEQHSITQPQIIDLLVDQLARIVSHQIRPSAGQQPLTAAVHALTNLSMMGALPPLPANPVAIGNEWTTTQVVPLRGTGDIKLNMHGRLVEYTDEQVVIESSGQGTAPEMQVPNPFVPEQTMKATNIKVTITRLQQICDPPTLVVRKAQGEATVSFDGVAPDYILPLATKLKFSLIPAAPPAGE